MSTFNNKNPNGNWSLYIVDDTAGDNGIVAGGWSLAITTSTPVNDTPPTVQFIAMQPNGNYRLAVRGQPGLRYTLHGAPDLQNFTPIQTFTMPNGGIYYYEEPRAAGCKFFRASKNQ